MKELTALYLSNADRDLGEARVILAAGVARQAARLSYLAQFQAAQALIIERTGKFTKTHKGVRTLFHRLARAKTALDQRLARDLTAAYRFKEAVVCETGDDANIAPAEAVAAISAAEHFVAEVNRVLAAPSITPPP